MVATDMSTKQVEESRRGGSNELTQLTVVKKNTKKAMSMIKKAIKERTSLLYQVQVSGLNRFQSWILGELTQGIPSH